MRQSALMHFAAAVALASVAGCSDAPTLSAPSTRTGAPSGSSPVVPASNGTLGFAAREIPVGERVLLAGPLVSADRYSVISTPLSWRTTDPAVVGLLPTPSVAWALGVRPGASLVTVTGGGLAANIPITVLDVTTAPAPVVVEDFYVIEFGGEGGWGYAPQFVLRDVSGTDGSAEGGLRLRAYRRAVTGKPVSTLRMVHLQFQAGDSAAGFASLERGVRERAEWIYRLPCFASVDEFRGTAHYRTLAAAIGAMPAR